MTASPESGSKVVEFSGEEPSGARKPGRRKLNVFCEMGAVLILISDALPFGRLWYGRAEDAIGL